jgi:hypothetical protein
MRRIVALLVLLGVFGLAPPARADGPDVELLLEAIRSTTLDRADAFAVGAVEIDLGFGRLEVSAGWIFPATAVGGHVFEALPPGSAAG